MNKCKHNKGTFYSPATGLICKGCKQKLIQVWITEKEKKEIKFLHDLTKPISSKQLPEDNKQYSK